MPTALAMSDAKYTGQLDLPGVDLISQLQDNNYNDRTLYFEHEGTRGIRSGDWKLVSLRDQPWELYKLTTKRTELENLADKNPDIVTKLDKEWEAWAKKNQVTPLPKNYQVGYLRVAE